MVPHLLFCSHGDWRYGALACGEFLAALQMENGMEATATKPSPSVLQTILAWTRRHPYTFWALVFITGMAIPFFAKPDEDAEWEMVYVSGARRLVAGENLYNGKDGYLYPPFAAFCAVPFTKRGERRIEITILAVVEVL